ncbi:MAG: barstar family protein [Planctomycetota bacterium]
MPLVRVDARRISDWGTFHDVFSEAFGFPGFYGKNLDAWIDCLSCLDDPDAGMTSVHGSSIDPVVLQLDHAGTLADTLFEALAEGVAFVNWRRLEQGDPAILMLACDRR